MDIVIAELKYLLIHAPKTSEMLASETHGQDLVRLSCRLRSVCRARQIAKSSRCIPCSGKRLQIGERLTIGSLSRPEKHGRESASRKSRW